MKRSGTLGIACVALLAYGKEELNPYYCLNKRGDGASWMSRSTGGPKQAKGVMFGGTGPMKGVKGTFIATETQELPADEGKIAGCRHLKSEYSVKRQ